MRWSAWGRKISRGQILLPSNCLDDLPVKTVIHVNQHKIKSNAKSGAREPVLTCKTYKSNDYGHEVEIQGPCKVVYSPDKPLPCGARVWIETHAEVSLKQDTDYKPASLDDLQLR